MAPTCGFDRHKHFLLPAMARNPSTLVEAVMPGEAGRAVVLVEAPSDRSVLLTMVDGNALNWAPTGFALLDPCEEVTDSVCHVLEFDEFPTVRGQVLEQPFDRLAPLLDAHVSRSRPLWPPPQPQPPVPLSFDDIFLRQFPVIVRRLTPLCDGNRQEAEQIAQEAFLQAYRKWDQLRDPERVFAWIWTIARRLCAHFVDEQIRMRGTRRFLQADYFLADPVAEATARLSIVAAIRRLPEKRQLIARLTLLEGLSVAEVASRLDMRPDNVRVHLSLARRQLRQLLTDEGGAR
jgi:RNA polymerase sigma-70 factor, ECF subfamily